MVFRLDLANRGGIVKRSTAMHMEELVRMFSWDTRVAVAAIDDWIDNYGTSNCKTSASTQRCALAELLVRDRVIGEQRRLASDIDAEDVVNHFHIPERQEEVACAINEFTRAWDCGEISAVEFRRMLGVAYGLTLDEAKGLRQGQLLNCWRLDGKGECLNADGTPMRFKVTSVKTWKRTPERVEIRVQRGLYEHYTFDQTELGRLRVGGGY